MAKKKPSVNNKSVVQPVKKKATPGKKAPSKKPATVSKPAAAKPAHPKLSAGLQYPKHHHGTSIEGPLEELAGDHHRVVMVNAVVTKNGGCGTVSIAGWDCHGNPTSTAFASVQFDSSIKVCTPFNTATLIIPPHGRYQITPTVCLPEVEFRMNHYEVT